MRNFYSVLYLKERLSTLLLSLSPGFNKLYCFNHGMEDLSTGEPDSLFSEFFSRLVFRIGRSAIFRWLHGMPALLLSGSSQVAHGECQTDRLIPETQARRWPSLEIDSVYRPLLDSFAFGKLVIKNSGRNCSTSFATGWWAGRTLGLVIIAVAFASASASPWCPGSESGGHSMISSFRLFHRRPKRDTTIHLPVIFTAT